ncbi:hypothetical protein PWT90_01058 [Aphanocladium album]|nr:hypothetical protein PWT90_01058 [Aphanocladium album]
MALKQSRGLDRVLYEERAVPGLVHVPLYSGPEPPHQSRDAASPNRTSTTHVLTPPNLPSITSRIADAPPSSCEIPCEPNRSDSVTSAAHQAPRDHVRVATSLYHPPFTKAPDSEPPYDAFLYSHSKPTTRLAKWYAPFSDEEKIKLKGEVHRLVAPRDQKYQSNFVEFRNHKIVYRRYAGLFFCVCVDTNDNELAYLEAIHFFVEVLDAFFGNVSELDLVFNFYKVYAILDEVFLAGEIEETSKQAVLTRLEHLDKLE